MQCEPARLASKPGSTNDEPDTILEGGGPAAELIAEAKDWNLPAGTYEFVPVAAGERTIRISTVDGKWPSSVAQELVVALARIGARREGWWKGHIAPAILDALAQASAGADA